MPHKHGCLTVRKLSDALSACSSTIRGFGVFTGNGDDMRMARGEGDCFDQRLSTIRAIETETSVTIAVGDV